MSSLRSTRAMSFLSSSFLIFTMTISSSCCLKIASTGSNVGWRGARIHQRDDVARARGRARGLTGSSAKPAMAMATAVS